MKDLVRSFRGYFLYIAGISFAVNLLMLTPPLFMLSVLDKVLTSRSNETLISLVLIAIYAVMIMAFLDNVQSRLLQRFGISFKKKVAATVLELNLRDLSGSELAAHGLDDVNNLEAFLSGNGIKAFFEGPWIPLYLLVLYLFHPLLAVVAVVLTILLFIVAYAEDRLTSQHEVAAIGLAREANGFAIAAKQNPETVSAMGMQEAIVRRWNRVNDEYLDRTDRSGRVSATTQALAKVIRVGGQMLGLTAGAYLVLNVQGVTQGVMVASILIMGRAMAPIANVIGAWKSFVAARTSYGRLTTLLNESEAEKQTSFLLPRPEGLLSVEAVSYNRGPELQILSGLNFELAVGESLGVIGPTGSGKTTLARLMVGLLPPSEGHVRLDGADVYPWARGDLGQYVGYVPQQVTLFPGTVADNIARMRSPETLSERIIAAAKAAHAHEMILSLPQGYSTSLVPGADRLSGGQRQLIGIARALFGRPSLVVMDEPNSNLDSSAEEALAKIFDSLRRLRVTLVIISHRPITVSDVDHLLVLRRGLPSIFGNRADVLTQLREASTPRLVKPELTGVSVVHASRGDSNV